MEEVRIRESGRGGYTVEKGIAHGGGARVPGMNGFTMKAFLVSESEHCDTMAEAKRAARRMQGRR